MCFGGGKVEQPPAVQAPPAPAPAPTITPSTVSAQAAGETRRKQLERLQTGIASTIKTSPKGIIGTGAELQAAGTGKERLGA